MGILDYPTRHPDGTLVTPQELKAMQEAVGVKVRAATLAHSGSNENEQHADDAWRMRDRVPDLRRIGVRHFEVPDRTNGIGAEIPAGHKVRFSFDKKMTDQKTKLIVAVDLPASSNPTDQAREIGQYIFKRCR